LLLLLLSADSFITKGKVFPILINKLIFWSESIFIPLLVFSRMTAISYSPPSERSLLLIVTGFVKLTCTRSFFDKYCCGSSLLVISCVMESFTGIRFAETIPSNEWNGWSNIVWFLKVTIILRLISLIVSLVFLSKMRIVNVGCWLPSFKNDGFIRPSIAICLPEISIGKDSSLLKPCPYALAGKKSSKLLLLAINKNNHTSKVEVNII
jgi:hypothetical protein